MKKLKFNCVYVAALLLMFLLSSPWWAGAETINVDLSQVYLSPELEYTENSIKLKSYGLLPTDLNYILPFPTYTVEYPYYIYNGYLHYYKYYPEPLSLPPTFGWAVVENTLIKQVNKKAVLTVDGDLTFIITKTYTRSGVSKFVAPDNYYYILYKNGVLKLLYEDANKKTVETVIANNVVDIFVEPLFRGCWFIKDNGELWLVGAYFSSSEALDWYVGPNSGCSPLVPCKKTDINNVVKVVSSYNGITALLSDGTVACWASYDNCGLGGEFTGYYHVPQKVKINSSTYLTNVLDISGNAGMFSALTNDNKLYVWGRLSPSSYATLKFPPASVHRFLYYGTEKEMYMAPQGVAPPLLLTLLSDGQFYDAVSGNVIPPSTNYLPPTLAQSHIGYAIVNIPLNNRKVVTNLSADLLGNVRFLFSTDGGSTWYKYSNGTFVTTLFHYERANYYSEIMSIPDPEAVFRFLTQNKNSLKIAMFLKNGTSPAQINGLSVQVVDLVTVSDIACDLLSVYPGQTINCNSQIQKDSSITDPLNVTWQILKSNGSNGGEIVNTSNDSDIYTATIRPIGVDTPKIVKVNACAGSTCVSKTQELTVQSLQAPQISLNCPASLYIGQSEDCIATIQLPEGLPSHITPVINWNATTGTQLTPNGNIASVIPVTETDKTITVKVSYNYAPDVFNQESAIIRVLGTEITGSLNCPTEAYKGQVITCTLEYQSTREGLSVQWLTPVESLSEDKKTAQVKVLSNTVTVKVYVTEYPSLYKIFTANLTMKIPPKPIVNVSATNSSGNTVYVSIPVTLKGTVVCPEGLTCSHEWYINDELQQVTELEFNKTFSQSGRQKVSLVAWVNEVEQRELVTSRSDYQLFVYNYPQLYMYAMVDKKYATVGDTVTFTAVDASKTDYSSIFPVKVSWILPDGSTVEGKTATYTVKESDIDPKNAVKKVVTFNYQYEGISESLKSGSITLVVLPPYRLPDFDIKLYTPQEGPVPHLVFAMPRALDKFLPGYQYNISYEWSIPELGITGNKKYFVTEIPEIGNFTLSLRVSDTLGNSVEKEIPITVVEPLPWTVNFKSYLSNKYKVAPLSVIIRPILSGGHPRDKMVSYSWYIDGQEVSNRSLLGVVFNEPGTYVISFSATSKFGNVVTGEYSIEVIPNQPPVCSLSNKVYSGTKTLYITASCTDPDDRIVDYTWQVNNGEEFKGGSKISVKYDTEPITVTLRVTDTGGNVTEVTETFSVPQ